MKPPSALPKSQIGLCHCHRHKQSGQGIFRQTRIAWRNVAGYSTESVAQHTFAMLFYLLEHLRYYDDYVKEDHYTNDTIFTHFAQTFYELKGKIWGIIGLKYRTQSSCDCRSFWCASHLCFPHPVQRLRRLPSGFS